jgi:PilZ domain
MASLTMSQSRNAVAERRRHARHTPSSIMYITAGSGNGGLLLNLGIGGLAIQAAGRLTSDQELVLQFKLAGSRDTITTVGRVAWLGPTQKEAGVCFADLPAAIEHRIADWIARQESATIEVRPSPKPVAAPPGNSVLPEPVSNQLITHPANFSSMPAGAILNARAGDAFPASPASRPSSTADDRGLVESEDRGSEDRQQQTNGKLNKSAGFSMMYGAPRHVSSLPAEVPAWLANQGPARSLPIVESAEVPPLAASQAKLSLAGAEAAGWSPVAAAPARLSFTPAEAAGMLVESSVLGSPEILASSELLAPSDVLADSRILAASSVSREKQPRRKLVLAALAAGLVLLAGIAISVRTAKVPRNPVPSREAVIVVAPPVNQPETERKLAVQQSIPVDADTGWSALLKKIFRHDDVAKLDPILQNVPVWTHQRNGFYYCAGSPEIEKLKTGSFMTQAEALQSGYQPNLGSYCY